MPRKKANAGRRGRARRAGARKSTARPTSASIEEATECSPQTTPVGTSPCVEEEVPATNAIAVPASQTTPNAMEAHLSSPSLLPVDSAEPPPSTDDPVPGNDGLSEAQSPAVEVQSEGEPLIADSPQTDYSKLRQCEALSEVNPKETDEVGEPGGEMETMERRKRRKTEIFIGGLDKDTKEEDIRKVFEQVGETLEVILLVNGKTRKNKDDSVALPTAAGSSSFSEPKTPNSSQVSQSTFMTKDDGKLKDMACLYKTRLQIYAQKRGLALPVYTSVHEGPTNPRRFKSEVMLDGKAYKSLEHFNTVKEAENAAAKVALSIVLPSGCKEDDNDCSKNLLQVFMQKEYHCLPKYTTSQFGASRVVGFVSSVEVNGESFMGDMAKTKKQAEANAAKVAYTTLKSASNIIPWITLTA